MGCLSRHRQKQECGSSSLAWSLEISSLHPGLHCHHCRFTVHHFSSWVEPRPQKGSSCVGCCHGGIPRSQCSHSPIPGAASRDPAPCRLHWVGTRAVQAPRSESTIFPGFFLLCLCLPIICQLKGVCWPTEIHLPHCLLCSFGLCRLTQEPPCPLPHRLSPWGHVVWEEQLS